MVDGSSIQESGAAGNCCDAIDNDCDGYIDGNEALCVEGDAYGNCDDGEDNDCDGDVDCDDSDCPCCDPYLCESYDQTTCQDCSDECSWSNGHCCGSDRFWNTNTLQCDQWDPCAPVCWNDFCVTGTIACCDGGSGFTYQEQASTWYDSGGSAQN